MSIGTVSRNFIKNIISEDVESGKYNGRVHTRFPPEPNGYLHIGHAKSICLNFGIGESFGGKYNLRFDDTNPLKEEQRYIEAIIEDIRWLGFDWEDRLFFASDYFEQLYEYAQALIKKGLAYVDDLSAEQIREYRGTLTESGRDSPYRNRTVDENLDLFERMKACEFPDGSRVLRAKIDMSSPNISLRDPVLYRILHASHPRTGETWCIYPLYDWAHGQSDSIEGITHSICTLEFEANRPLYNWFLDELDIYHPQQIEFARLNLTYTVMSKRKLGRLVSEGHVHGWDDPRMPTLSGLRRRGYRPEAIRQFCDLVGVSKTNSTVDLALLEHVIRDDLNQVASRVMAVLRPLRVVIENYPEDQVEEFQIASYPHDKGRAETRIVPFSREIYIEESDFSENPPKKFFRLAPGREVRLIGAYYITCQEVVKDDLGQVIELRCTYDPESRGGSTPDGRKVRGSIHWVSAAHALTAELRLYNTLFLSEFPEDTGADSDFTTNINPDSLEILPNSWVEPSLADGASGPHYQFMRQGYFYPDPADSTPDQLVFNRTITLRDTWAKLQKQGR